MNRELPDVQVGFRKGRGTRDQIVNIRWIMEKGRNLPATQETWFQSLGWEDPLEEGMATHSRILAWRIPWTGEPGGLQSMESQIGHD